MNLKTTKEQRAAFKAVAEKLLPTGSPPSIQAKLIDDIDFLMLEVEKLEAKIVGLEEALLEKSVEPREPMETDL